MNDTTEGLPPLVHSIPSAAKRAGTNDRGIYRAIARGELKSFKRGKRRLILDSEIQRMIEREAAGAEAA